MFFKKKIQTIFLFSVVLQYCVVDKFKDLFMLLNL